MAADTWAKVIVKYYKLSKYKRVLNELAERWSQPCGLYFCSHETDETSRVSAWFAALILGVILLIMFVITIITQG